MRLSDGRHVTDLAVDELHAVVLGEDSRFAETREVLDGETMAWNRDGGLRVGGGHLCPTRRSDNHPSITRR